ncbi:glycosyltransferase family 2 protein [Pseudobutyrivibrio sp.]|uniref:glycosyltransferase family 2 protein n=1 Tax=Pseudobutyrivibrio sp. TaxID=2014367 RepID=UPI003869CABF
MTVIIPAYNVEQYIEQCANSVLHQTLEDIEIIFIDDGSTDKTGNILDSITNDFTNTRVVHQENKGLYKTREIGISLATGDYIGWIDADDYVELNMFEVLYNTAIEHDSELVLCDYSWFPKKITTKEKWFREYKGKVDTTFVERNSQPWNKIVKTELMEKLNIRSLFVPCLDEIYIRILMEAKNPVAVNQALYNYRVGSGTMSSSYTNVTHYRRFVIASKELCKVMQPAVQDSYWKDYFDYRVAYYLLMTMVVAANTGDRDTYEQNRRELFDMQPEYNKNQHYHRILKENYGTLKAKVIGGVIPIGYGIAHLACKVGLR